MLLLTDEKLIFILKSERITYSGDYFPLYCTKIISIEKRSKLIAENLKEIRRNILRKRACVILNNLWKSAPAMFVLCALVTLLNTPGSNILTAYLGRVLK